VLKVKNHVTFLQPSSPRLSSFDGRLEGLPLFFFCHSAEEYKVIGPPLFARCPAHHIYIYMLYAFEKSDPIRTNVAITDKIYHMLEMEMCDMVPDVTA
jgi:hypothetical protein